MKKGTEHLKLNEGNIYNFQDIWRPVQLDALCGHRPPTHDAVPRPGEWSPAQVIGIILIILFRDWSKSWHQQKNHLWSYKFPVFLQIFQLSVPLRLATWWRMESKQDTQGWLVGKLSSFNCLCYHHYHHRHRRRCRDNFLSGGAGWCEGWRKARKKKRWFFLIIAVIFKGWLI